MKRSIWALGAILVLLSQQTGIQAADYSEIPVIVQKDADGNFQVFFNLVADNSKDIDEFKDPIFSADKKKQEPTNQLLRLNEITFTLTDDNTIIDQKKNREDEAWFPYPSGDFTNRMRYVINTLKISTIKPGIGNYWQPDFMKIYFGKVEDKWHDIEQIKEHDAYLDKDLVDLLNAPSETVNDKTNLDIIREAAIKKLQEKAEKAGGKTGGSGSGSAGTSYTVNYTEILTKLGTGYSSETGDLYDESKLIKRMLLNIDVAKKTVSLNTTQAKLNDPNSDSELAGITAGPNDFAGNRVVLRKKIDQTDKTIYVIFGRNKNQEFLIGDNLVNPDGFIGGEWSKTFKFDKSMTDFLGTRDGDKTYLDKAIDYALMLAVTSAKDDGKTIPAAESWVIGRNEQGEKIEKTETEPEKKITEPVQADHTAVNQLADLLYQLAR